MNQLDENKTESEKSKTEEYFRNIFTESKQYTEQSTK